MTSILSPKDITTSNRAYIEFTGADITKVGKIISWGAAECKYCGWTLGEISKLLV